VDPEFVDVMGVDNVLNTDFTGGVSHSGDSLDISGDSPSIDHSVPRFLVQQSSCTCGTHVYAVTINLAGDGYTVWTVSGD
jgi:hypothetical protein